MEALAGRVPHPNSPSLESLPAPQLIPFHLTPLDTQASSSCLVDSGLPFSLAEAQACQLLGFPAFFCFALITQLALSSSTGF